MPEGGATAPRVWGWQTDHTRNAVWRAYVWCRLGAAGIVGGAAIAGAGAHGALREAVIALALLLIVWVAATTALRHRIRRALEARPRLGLVEVAVGMALVGFSGPNGAFSGWTAAPVAMAAILRPGWRWLAGVAAVQIALVWTVGPVLAAWGGDPTYAENITVARALLSPIDYAISYGLIALLGAALRRGDRLHARAAAGLEAARAKAARLAREAEDVRVEVGRQRALVDDRVGRPCAEIHRLLGVIAEDAAADAELRAALARLDRRFRGLDKAAPSGVRNLGELLAEAMAREELAGVTAEWVEDGHEPFRPLGTRIAPDAAEHLVNFFEEAVANMLRHGVPPYLVEVRGDRAGHDDDLDTITVGFVSHIRPHEDGQSGRWILSPQRRAGRRGHGTTIMERAAAGIGGSTHTERHERGTGPAHGRVLRFPAERVRAAVSGNPGTT